MLNISHNKVRTRIHPEKFSAYARLHQKPISRSLRTILISGLIIFIIFLFLPWTQNIRADGNVIAKRPDQRPQTIHSVIAGRIEKWFVQEGEFVKKGDTILFISEVKDDYFDPQLLERTQQQLKAKELSVNAYMEKIKAKDAQIDALVETGKLKLKQVNNRVEQAKLSVQNDSIELEAANTNYDIAKLQFQRMEALYKDGLKSLTDLEGRKLTLQKTLAEKISAENKLLSSKNNLINARIEETSIKAQYKDEIAKAESEKYAALSNMYDAEAVVTKLQNQYMNYEVRSGLYFIVAPLDGYITKAIQSGIGETLKEGDDIVSIMPANYDLAIEMFIKPMDLPLLDIGQTVRIQFDGWPAIVFSGWPNTSHGTYGGKIFAIDKFIGPNGKYRVLAEPDTSDYTWPTGLQVGSGTNSMVLLKDVPIWYELWRQINGFPPDFYKEDQPKISAK